jgi:endonuclease IV
MYWIGAPVSVCRRSGQAPERAAAIGARAFASSPVTAQWAAKPLAPEESDAFKKACQAARIRSRPDPGHGSYLINLGATRSRGPHPLPAGA